MDVETVLRGISLSEEFACDLGDPRRTRRVCMVGERLATRPEWSLPDLFEDPSELEATYRLFRNPNVSLTKLVSAHVAATVERCAGLGTVLGIHDTTEFSFEVRDGYVRKHLARLSASRQGFYSHVTLAASADGLRAPLGALNCFSYVHRSQVDSETRKFWDDSFGSYERESERWAKAIRDCEARIAGSASIIHVCDREADMNDVLQCLHQEGWRYVIRAFQDRKSVDGTRVGEIPKRSQFSVRRTIDLSPRPVQSMPNSRKSFPARSGRSAEVRVRASRAPFTIDRRHMVVDINVVEVLEENPPAGEKPVHWVLLTSEPIDNEQDLLRVVDIYRSRWLIEEYFKAIKTGCAYEERQLDSATTLLAALGITLVLAWQLLVLRHLSRLEDYVPDDATPLPASVVLTPQMLAVLIILTPKLKWPPDPTLRDVARGIARLGGHHRSNGPPGWRVLGRGFQKLVAAHHAARAVAMAGLVIDP